jgi:hypothetical protein
MNPEQTQRAGPPAADAGSPPAAEAGPPRIGTPERWQITVQAVGAGPPIVVRVRRALKHLLRAHGLKCVACRSTPTAITENQTP